MTQTPLHAATDAASADRPVWPIAALQQALEQLIEDTLVDLRTGFAALDGDLTGLLGYARANLGASPRTDAALPGTKGADLEGWRQLLSLFLTANNELRRKVDKRQGLPTARESIDPTNADAWKAVWAALRDQLAARPALLALAEDAMHLPPATIAADQWQVLDALTRLLPELAARLELVFQRHGQCDFTAIALAALRALGGDEEPSDLALHLDYRLRHILVDECQDTSGVQFDLLRRLTAGWQDGDGRTLFLVGDGMQSLYGFRDANVGLFLDSRRHPLGAIRLQPLDLSVPGDLSSAAFLIVAAALVPGVSRSGGTISIGLLLGYTREAAARYSFLLAIPAVLASGFYQLFRHWGEFGPFGFGETALATAISFIVGYGVIVAFLRIISTYSFMPFVWYRVAIGSLLLILLGFGILSPI